MKNPIIKPTKDEIRVLVKEMQKRITALPEQKTAMIRNLRKEFSRKIAGYPPVSVFSLAYTLTDLNEWVCRWFAYELIAYHEATAGMLGEKELMRLGKGIDSWYAVDTFACFLSGPAWRKRLVADDIIFRWAKSNDRWWRRAAIVSTVPLNNTARGGVGDPRRTIAVCKMLVEDRDDMVEKALSWALRELSKKDSESVKQFMEKHKNRLGTRVIREVKHKLTTGLKNPRISPKDNR
jgi:3-methyladenine DNA glycosylase AlkD